MNDQTNTSKFNNSYRSGSPYCLRRMVAKPDKYVDQSDENVENSVVGRRRLTRNRPQLGSQSTEKNCDSFEVSSVESNENSVVGIRRLTRNRSQFGSQSIEKNCDSFEVPPIESDLRKDKKRKRSVTISESPGDEPPAKHIDYYPHKKKDCVYIELHLTGFTADEEIVKFVAYHPSSSAMIGNFTYPTSPNRKMAYKMAVQTGIEVDCQMMLSDNELVPYGNIRVVLEEFVVFIESLNSEDILLVYENRFGLLFIPAILVRFLSRFDLLERVQGKIAGFIDCAQLFGGEEHAFDLDLHLPELKTSLLAKHLFYRVEALSKYFHVNGRPQVESVLKFEHAKAEAAGLDEERSEENQLEEDKENEDSMAKIVEEARTINETKSYLTMSELRNLYLLQKLKYQWILSRTYKPKKKFPTFKPKKKLEKAGEKRMKSFSLDIDDRSEVAPDESILSKSLLKDAN